jgi:hypothetical protein
VAVPACVATGRDRNLLYSHVFLTLGMDQEVRRLVNAEGFQPGPTKQLSAGPEPGVAWTLPKGTATPITPRMMASIAGMAITRAMDLLGLLLGAAPSPRDLSSALKGFARIPPAASYPLNSDLGLIGDPPDAADLHQPEFPKPD